MDGERKNGRRGNALATSSNVTARCSRPVFAANGVKRKEKGRRVCAAGEKASARYVRCTRRDARPPTVSCVAEERRRDARARPRTTEDVETTPGVDDDDDDDDDQDDK